MICLCDASDFSGEYDHNIVVMQPNYAHIWKVHSCQSLGLVVGGDKPLWASIGYSKATGDTICTLTDMDGCTTQINMHKYRYNQQAIVFSVGGKYAIIDDCTFHTEDGSYKYTSTGNGYSQVSFNTVYGSNSISYRSSTSIRIFDVECLTVRKIPLAKTVRIWSSCVHAFYENTLIEFQSGMLLLYDVRSTNYTPFEQQTQSRHIHCNQIDDLTFCRISIAYETNDVVEEFFDLRNLSAPVNSFVLESYHCATNTSEVTSYL